LVMQAAHVERGNGNRYCGDTMDEIPHGQGIVVNGVNEFAGNWANGDEVLGELRSYEIGFTYAGECANGRLQGLGVMHRNGAVYKVRY
ncbi:hypothetical protein PMAYCL1PPCAC_25833, partial [Pristionchus mayeri]